MPNNWIILTDYHSETDAAILINLSNVTRIKSSGSSDATWVYDINGQIIAVKESLEEIVNQIVKPQNG